MPNKFYISCNGPDDLLLDRGMVGCGMVWKYPEMENIMKKKLCVDCKFFEKNLSHRSMYQNFESEFCLTPENINLVTGDRPHLTP